MPMPDLLFLPLENDYKKYFIDNYCSNSSIFTWDNLPVVFFPDMFEHAFYKRDTKSWHSKKSQVDLERCKRLPWIKEVLMDSTIIPRQGYDKEHGVYDNSRRVTLVSQEKYVVVIRNDGKKWRFVTAYLIDNNNTYNKIMASPVWSGSA